MTQSLRRCSILFFLLALGSITVYAQQGFGTDNPSKASAVEMESGNRGLLIPRVELESLTNFTPITGETGTNIAKTNSLLVYNTAEVDEDIYPGYYYWTTDGVDGQWNRLLTAGEISTIADNGLTKVDDNIQLGGALLDDTEINLDGNNLALLGLPSGSEVDNVVVADVTTGNLKQVKQAPRSFYMPSVIFDTSSSGGPYTRDLYEEYRKQFEVGTYYITGENGGSPTGPGTPMQYTGGIVKSTSAPSTIATYESDELYYYITYYDQNVFSNLSITDDGKLTYTIDSTATDTSYMVIVFVVKE